MNPSIFFGVLQFCVYLTAVSVVGPVTCVVGGGGDDDVLGNSDLDVIRKQLNRRWKTILGPSWWSAVAGSQRKDAKTAAAAAVMPSTTKSPRRRSTKLSGGFFGTRDGRRRAPEKTAATTVRRYVTNRRPKDAGRERDAAVDGGADVATATAPVGHGRAAYGDENECVSANNGRPCSCDMTGFLDAIGERLDDEAVADNRTTAVATAFRRCPSYKPVPEAFVVYAANVTAAAQSDETAADEPIRNDSGNAATAVALSKVDFDSVVNHQLETSKDDYYAVHYCFVGSDVKIRCSINTDYNNDTEITAFKWDYRKSKKKTNSTITGTDSRNLFILGLDPRDSKNYTCSPYTGTVGKLKNDGPYTHNVIAVVEPSYEIHGTMFYKTADGSGDCTPEITNNVRKQLSSSIRSEICPEGPSQYACNVDVQTSKCVEDEAGTLEIKYLVVLNDEASHLIRIRNSKKGRNALYYQQLLARISNELAENLNKTMTVKIMAQMSNHEHFEPVYGRMKIDKYVSCAPGFGIREVFCAACPPHHYSPDKTAECLKCPKGFHQPFVGSKKCVKCPSVFSSGCYMREVPRIVFYSAGFICLLVFSVIAAFCLCCCREENETDIRIIPRKMRRKFKKSKGYNMLTDNQTSIVGLQRKLGKFKKITRIGKKSKRDVANSKMTFKQLNDEFNPI